MNKNIINIECLIKSVRENSHTMLAVDIEGNIRYCVGLKEIPKSVPQFNKLAEGKVPKGCSISFIVKDLKYDENKARKKINSSVESLLYAKTHKLEPGVNIPQEKERD